MATKRAINGVISMKHGDIVAKGVQNYEITEVSITDSTGSASGYCTLYFGNSATAGNEVAVMAFNGTTGACANVPIQRACTTGGGLLYNDGDSDTICLVHVR